MTAKFISAEGAAVGTALVTGGNYGGSNLDLVSKTGSGNLVIASQAGMSGKGPQSVRITSAAASDTALIRFTGFGSTHMAAHAIFAPDAIPTANAAILTLRHSAGSNLQIQHLATSGKLRIIDSTGSTTVWDSPSGYPLATAQRISVYADQAAGTVSFRVYPDWQSTTAVSGWSVDLTGVNLGTNAFAAAQIGKLGTASVQSMYLDDFRVDDAITGILPPETDPPTLSYAQTALVKVTPTVSAGSTVTLTQASGPTATITGPDGSGAFEVVPPSPQNTAIVLTLTATNSAGSTVQTVTIQPPGNRGRKVRVTGVYV